MKRNKTIQGRTHIKLKKDRDRTLLHLDPLNPLNASDHARFSALYKAARARESVLALYGRARDDLKFPSLGGGFMLDSTGKEITSEEHFVLLKAEQELRNYYVQETTRNNGTTRLRHCPSDPLHALAISYRPDHALALHLMEKDPANRTQIKQFVRRMLVEIAAEFQIATGLPVVAGECHPEEGNLHFHLVYATISRDHRLLWNIQGKGRKGLRLLGPGHIGTLRLVDAKYLAERDASLARKDLTDRMRSIRGELPVDLRLSLALDALCDQFFKATFPELYLRASKQYREELRQRMNERPSALKEKIRRLTQEKQNLSDQLAAVYAQQQTLISRNITSEHLYIQK